VRDAWTSQKACRATRAGPGGHCAPQNYMRLAVAHPIRQNPGSAARAACGRPPVSTPDSDTIVRLLAAARQGDADALNQLAPLVYDELRRIAYRQMRHERQGHTLQPTALANEAWARLMGARRLDVQNRAHFMGIAANAMRQILVERARAHGAAKRGGAAHRVTLDERLVPAGDRPIDVEALDEVLRRLEQHDPELARIVELRFFGGLTVEETAEELGNSPATVKRRWTLAKAWLMRELQGK
jgi:RNA polymerase sigma factor (TIGR02999 family)